MNIDIKHYNDNNEFIADINGDKGKLDYKMIDSDVVDMRSTFVPESARNKGIGGKLVKKALEYAKSNDLQVKPSCPFVKAYIEKNPEYKNLTN